jgi:assimilatory nitrate reductase catalytic subunit
VPLVAQFAALPYRPVAEPRDARFPFALNTGRLRDQWHGMSRTGTLGRLFGHAPEPVVELNAQDLARLRVVPGDLLMLRSRRGSLVLPVQASDSVPPAQAFVAMHWGDEFVRGGVNLLTSPALCPQSRQPELKHAAVHIERAELPWRLVALAWCDEVQALQLRRALRPFFNEFAFAACVPFGRERAGVLFRAAAATPASAELVARVATLFELQGAQALHYADARRGQRRSLRLSSSGDEQRLEAFLLAGDTRAEAWIAPLLQQGLPAQAYGRLMLLPGAQPPLAAPTRARQVCSCFDVSETAIAQVLGTCTGGGDSRLAAVQRVLRCGTQCGSCLPELKRLVAPQTVAA